MAKGLQVVFDCANPDQLAQFWAAALGYIMQPPPEGYSSWEALLKEMGLPESDWDKASAVIDPEGKGPRIFFQKVPEGKATKNRVHLDINIGDRDIVPDERRNRVDEHVAYLQSIGATLIKPGSEVHGEYWVVLQDPEGNEFCVQ